AGRRARVAALPSRLNIRSTHLTRYGFGARVISRRTMSLMKVSLIMADGLQLAALGAYGNDWLATPNIDRLAAQSVVFDQHFADVPTAGWNHVRQDFPPAQLFASTFDVANLRVMDIDGLLP